MSSSTAEKPRPGWVGPVLGWELLRLGRRGTTTWMRVLVALLLFAALWAVYLAKFPEKDLINNTSAQIATSLSQFTEHFAYVYMMAQLGVICLLTPIYVVGAMAEERDRKTLEFLLATDLSNWEIIVGKLGSRMLQLIGILLAGIPIIALMQVWGGVETLGILIGSGIALLTLFGVGGICAACSAIPGTMRSSTIRSFLAVIFFYCGLLFVSPFRAFEEAITRLNSLDQGDLFAWSELWRFAKFQLVLGFLGIYLSVYWLRRLAFSVAPRKRLTRSRTVTALKEERRSAVVVLSGWESEDFAEAAASPRVRELRHWADPPRIGHRPLFWKEVHFSGQMNRFLRLLALFPTWLWTLIGMVIAIIAMSFADDAHFGLESNLYARIISLLFLFMMCVAIGLSAAGSVSRERQQQTIIDLLMIPRPRSHFLLAKWFASLKKGLGLFCAVIAILVAGWTFGFFLVGGLSFWTVWLLPLATVVYACFAASLGLYLSVRCKTVLRASSLWMLMVLLLLGGTYLLAESQGPSDKTINRRLGYYDEERYQPFPSWDRILNPVLAWNQMAFSMSGNPDRYVSSEFSEQRWGILHHFSDLFPALYGLIFYACLAWLFWWMALDRFEREGKI